MTSICNKLQEEVIEVETITICKDIWTDVWIEKIKRNIGQKTNGTSSVGNLVVTDELSLKVCFLAE